MSVLVRAPRTYRLHLPELPLHERALKRLVHLRIASARARVDRHHEPGECGLDAIAMPDDSQHAAFAGRARAHVEGQRQQHASAVLERLEPGRQRVRRSRIDEDGVGRDIERAAISLDHRSAGITQEVSRARAASPASTSTAVTEPESPATSARIAE